MSQSSLKHSIQAQRALLNDLLSTPLKEAARTIASLQPEQQILDDHLRELFPALEHCKYIYVLDPDGVQISSTVNRYGADEESIGRDRSRRPYMQHIHDKSTDFRLSEAYISRNKKRPSVTAVQTILDDQGQLVGYLGVDYDLRELPHSDVIYEEPSQWQQIKGDPVIRQGLFLQERVESLMDKHMDDVMSVHQALMLDQGVHHFQIHFSSSRTTIWHIDDPYIYHILTIDELIDPNTCLAYPRRPWPKRAVVSPRSVGKILRLFKELRFADETIYLRSGSLNIINGKIGLNFSCDGTHYLNHDRFLEKGLDFWFGGDSFPQTANPAEPQPKKDLDMQKLDTLIEELAGLGCMKVNKLLYTIEKGEVPDTLQSYSEDERDHIYQELKSVMDVYEGAVCDL